LTQHQARRAAEAAARASYGRLLSVLSARSRDIAASEDALSDAFVAALRSWPDSGVPNNPDAWLLTAARNSLKNGWRHQGVAAASALDLALLQDEAAPDAPEIPDDRLKLLFVCAKATINQAGLRFELPGAEDMPGRLADVLNAIYAAYGSSWDAVAGADSGGHDLAQEALFLSRLLVALLPAEPEARGLLALMLYCESRRAARRAPDGSFVPLSRQDTRLWSHDMIAEAEQALTTASQAGVFGRFQCEAAIQSVHAQRPLTGRTHHDALAMLYRLLAAHCPSVGVRVAQAAAMVEAGRPELALEVLRQLAGAEVSSYQPYWVTMAAALAAKGDAPAARRAQQTAIGLTEDPAVRSFLAASGRV